MFVSPVPPFDPEQMASIRRQLAFGDAMTELCLNRRTTVERPILPLNEQVNASLRTGNRRFRRRPGLSRNALHPTAESGQQGADPSPSRDAVFGMEEMTDCLRDLGLR